MENFQNLAAFGNITFIYGMLLGAMITIVILAAFEGIKACGVEKRAAERAAAKPAAKSKKRK